MLLQRLQPLLDGVLVRAGEGRVDQVARVGVARVDRQLGAVLHGATDLVDVGEVDLRVDALAEQVHRQRDQVDVAGPLAVPEQAALDAVGAGHHRELGRRDRRTAVVVRVQRDRGVLAPGQLAGEPLDLVGVDVRRGHLDGGRQVEDDLAAVLGLPHVGDRLADVDGERQLGAGEDLRGVLVADHGRVEVGLGELHHHLGARVRRSTGSRPCRRGRRPGGTAAPGRCRGGCWRAGCRPATATVRSMRSSRAWVSTEIVTSSGTRSPSMSWRTKSKSVSLADGKPTSISL